MDYFFFFFYIGVFTFTPADKTVHKKYPSTFESCEILNTSGVKLGENFAHSFFIDSITEL